MNPFLLAFLLPLYATNDTWTCAYWYDKLDQIATYEELKLESDRIAAEENPYAAMDFVEDLNRRIKGIQKKIDEDTEREERNE